MLWFRFGRCFIREDAMVQIWKMLYQMGKEGKLDVFEEK
jgi:hypothetical protein